MQEWPVVTEGGWETMSKYEHHRIRQGTYPRCPKCGERHSLADFGPHVRFCQERQDEIARAEADALAASERRIERETPRTQEDV